MKSWLLGYILMIFIFTTTTASAAALEKPNQPNVVLFGIYLNSLYDLNLADGTFSTDFYAWWRSRDKNFDPLKTMEIVNALDYKIRAESKQKTGDEYLIFAHYYATIQKQWNLTQFPFEHQRLEIRLEDFVDIHALVFEPDYAQSSIHHETSVSGWDILGFKLEKSVTLYNTNFGDATVPKGLYSRLSVIIDLKHEGWNLYFNYFLGFFISAFISALVFIIRPTRNDARIGLLLSAIFTYTGSKYVLKDIMAHTTGYTLPGLIAASTFIMVFSATLFFVVSEFMVKAPEKDAPKLPIVIGCSLFILYVATVGIGTYYAIVS